MPYCALKPLLLLILRNWRSCEISRYSATIWH